MAGRHSSKRDRSRGGGRNVRPRFSSPDDDYGSASASSPFNPGSATPQAPAGNSGSVTPQAQAERSGSLPLQADPGSVASPAPAGDSGSATLRTLSEPLRSPALQNLGDPPSFAALESPGWSSAQTGSSSASPVHDGGGSSPSSAHQLSSTSPSHSSGSNRSAQSSGSTSSAKKDKRKKGQTFSWQDFQQQAYQQLKDQPQPLASQSLASPSPAWREPRPNDKLKEPPSHALKVKPPPTDNDIKLKLQTFLKEFPAMGSSNPYYPAYSQFMRISGNLQLEVKFEHLISYDLDLAIDLCNMGEQRRNSFLPLVKNFLGANSYSQDEVDRATLTFSGMPKRIEYIKSILERNQGKLVAGVKDLLHEGEVIPVMEEISMFLVEDYLTDFLNQHKLSLSWNGDFDLSHFVVIDNQHCQIIKTPKRYSNRDDHAQACCSDLKTFESLISPILAKAVRHLMKYHEERFKEKIKSGVEYPLFYPQLRGELTKVDPHSVRASWFREYILNSPVLRFSDAWHNARHNLVCNLSLISRLDLEPEVKKNIDQVLGYCSFGEKEKDWRAPVRDSKIRVLSDIYVYEHTEKGKKNTHERKKASEGTEITEKGKKNTSEGIERGQRFSQDIRGILTYNRNFLQHAHHYVSTPSITITEVSISSFLEPYLHVLIKLLLRRNLLEDTELKRIWRNYKSLRVLRCDEKDILEFSYPVEFWNSILAKEEFPSISTSSASSSSR